MYNKRSFINFALVQINFMPTTSMAKIYSKNDFNTAFEPGHEKMCLMSFANNKGTDQPEHPETPEDKFCRVVAHLY